MLCVQCKTELPEGSQFCLKCGHAQKISIPKSNSPLKILGWMGLGVAITTIGFFCVANYHKTCFDPDLSR